MSATVIEARYYTKLEGDRVRCDLCPHKCRLRGGMTGICLSRKNEKGVLATLNYCSPVSAAVDPIEKKPLYHFYPGSQIFSTGPNGCTFKCLFCQNCEISQEVVPTRRLTPEKLVSMAMSSGGIGIAYTYSEPYIWFETIMEVGSEIRERGLKNVMVTNGFMEPRPLAELLGIVDAMNIDIKSIRPEFYRRQCKARLEPVLRTAEEAKKKCHVEITNLVIPAENDSDTDIRDLASYIAGNLGRDTPLHFSRYFPRHRMNTPPTPERTLERAYAIASDLLDFVYVGNVHSSGRSNTCCPGCGHLLISRDGYSVSVAEGFDKGTGDAACPCCGARVPLVL
jgi:pyruvate formate lyase activating enzyme